MTKHTKGPTEAKDISKIQECGCVGMGRVVNYCPVHDTAPEMLEALKDIFDKVLMAKGEEEVNRAAIAHIKKIADLVAKAEGGD